MLHLAALAGEDTWENLLRVNVDGTRTVLAVAQRVGVPRVLLASSIHAAGFYRRAGSTPSPAGVPAPGGPDGVPAGVYPRPDSFYGWTKAAVESLGSLYADRFGMTVFALRIGACSPEPPGHRGLDGWLSPGDCARLVEACLTADVTGYRVLWGVSGNSRRWWSLAEGRQIGYRPVDDAERYAGTIVASTAERDTDGLLGANFCTFPLGVRRQRPG
nr:NAD(P)-dependent oxidoreductase [Micromonospora sp. DSM 115978]